MARQLGVIARDEAAVHRRHVAVLVRVHDVLGADDRKTAILLLQLRVRLAEVVGERRDDVEVLAAALVEQFALRLQKVFRSLVFRARSKRAELAADERRNSVRILVVNLDLTICYGTLCEGNRCRQEHEDCEQLLHLSWSGLSLSLARLQRQRLYHMRKSLNLLTFRNFEPELRRSEERRVGKECRSR